VKRGDCFFAAYTQACPGLIAEAWFNCKSERTKFFGLGQSGEESTYRVFASTSFRECFLLKDGGVKPVST